MINIQNIPRTTSFLIAVIQALIYPVADFDSLNTVTIVTFKEVWCTGWLWSATEMFQFIGFVSTIIVPIADVGHADTTTVLTGELVLLTGWIAASSFIAAISTIIASVTPGGSSRREGILDSMFYSLCIPSLFVEHTRASK